jgi:hypothetical protein
MLILIILLIIASIVILIAWAADSAPKDSSTGIMTTPTRLAASDNDCEDIKSLFSYRNGDGPYIAEGSKDVFSDPEFALLDSNAFHSHYHN